MVRNKTPGIYKLSLHIPGVFIIGAFIIYGAKLLRL